MTYSLIAQCPTTGAFGGVVGTSSLAVGSRCLHIVHGEGAVLSQHRTDPRLGVQGLALLREGLSASDTIAELVQTPDIGWRQLAVLDRAGGTAFHHGERIYSICTASLAERCIAIGNILANEHVTDAMVGAFDGARAEPLEERLMRALEAGRDAGGEITEPLRSAALCVSGPDGLDRLDLRVDMAAEAASALRALLDAYADKSDIQRTLALAPGSVPLQQANFEASRQRIAERGLEARFPLPPSN